MVCTQVLQPDDDSIARAAMLLRSGQLVAFPTETVYGLGANALDSESVKKIFAAKGRPADNPLILHVGHMDQVQPLVKHIPPIAAKLMRNFWPGPLTLIMHRAPVVPDIVSAGLDTVALRMPDHPVALALLQAVGLPLAAPSANLSGRPSPTTAAHVLADLGGRIAAILDGGRCDLGVESTVLDVTVDPAVILRPGGVTYEQLSQVIAVHRHAPVDQVLTIRSPGQKYQHYAPRTRLVLVDGPNREEIAEEITKRISRCQLQGRRVGVLTSLENASHYEGIPMVILGSYRQPEVISNKLFTALRQMDDWGVDVVFCETFPEAGLGAAIMDRLQRAAGVNPARAGEEIEKEPVRILFVCTGNTCRSPTAELLMKEMLKRSPIQAKVEVSSAGLQAWPGSPLSEHARELLQEAYGHSAEHTARRLNEEMLRHSDWILTMTAQQREAVLALVADAGRRVRVLSEFVGQDGDIPDPFGGDREDYRIMMETVTEAVAALIDKINKREQDDEDCPGQ